MCSLWFLFFKDFIYLFLERREGEREEEKLWCMRETSIGYLSHVSHAGDQACNPGMCHDQELNSSPFALQDNAQLSHIGQGSLWFLNLQLKYSFGYNTSDNTYRLYLAIISGNNQSKNSYLKCTKNTY